MKSSGYHENWLGGEDDPLAMQIARYAKADGDFGTQIPGLYFYRRSRVSTPMPCFYGLGLAVGIQGKKIVVAGGETFESGPGLSLLTMVDLPVVWHISEATTAKPYFGLLLTLDTKLIAQLSAELEMSYVAPSESRRALSHQPIDQNLHIAVQRLVMLLDERESIRVHVAPLIQREIYIRLLMGAHGPTLSELVAAGSPRQQIARAVSLLKQHFRKSMKMDDLALYANMSPSTFRQHFRTVCGMSPLQFQKRLRLQEARQTLLAQRIDTSEVAHLVGYESVSQFIRDYRRLFGNPPLRDLKMQQGFSVTSAAES
jgi:AraC-like DNA-binding protein